MINNTTAKVTYTTVAGVTQYAIGFDYETNPNGSPQIKVILNKYTTLVFGTDYTVSGDGVYVVLTGVVVVDGDRLDITRDIPMVQLSDYHIGRIDPEQIERDFDLATERDQQLDAAISLLKELPEEHELRIRALEADVATIESEIPAEASALNQLADKNYVTSSINTFAGTLATVATSGSYNDLSDTPTIGNATLTIQKNSETVDTFTANATSDKTINISVPVTASDVNALPDSTKYAASASMTIDNSTYVITLQLKDQDNNNIGSSQTIDLPLESVVVSGAYDNVNKEIVLTLQNGSTIDIPVADLVAGLQTEITSNNMLDADLVDDSTSTNKFVTASDKTNWDGKVNKSGDTMTGELIMAYNNAVSVRNSNASARHYIKADGQDLLQIGTTRNQNIKMNWDSTSGDLYSALSTSTLGTSTYKWANVYTANINNGADIAVPVSGGTMALTSDIITTVSGLSDVTVTSATSGQVLEYNGSGWVNATQTHHGNDITTGTTYYGTISQGGSQYATVAFDSTVNIVKGDVLIVKWGIAQNTANNLKMNTLSSTSIPLMYKGSQIAANILNSGDVMEVVYDGTYFQLMSVNKWAGDTTNMMTTNTAQNVTALKTFISASADATTMQTIVANYAIKFGTSGNDDLFAISANPNTNTLNIVGDNANNIICLAASGAVMNKFEVSSTDVTFGGTSLVSGDGTITITQGGVTKGTFTVNQSGDTTIALDAGGGGGSVDIDGTTITKNGDDEIQAVATVNANTAAGATNPVYDWVGTLAEYESQAVATNHPDWVCYITDDVYGGDTVYTKTEVDNSFVGKGHEVIAFQAPTAGNNYTWYRKYADGWVEQGGIYDNGSLSDDFSTTVTLPITMADTNYTALAIASRNTGNAGSRAGYTNVFTQTTTQLGIGYYRSESNNKMRYLNWRVEGMYAQS